MIQRFQKAVAFVKAFISPAPSGYAKNGLHIFSTKLPPDWWLKLLNPQTLVIVGSFEHQDAIDRTRAAAAHLVELLPNCTIKVRWWKDDNILRTISPQGFKMLFFPLHVPDTVLGVGNEDSAGSEAHMRENVAAWCEVVDLATEARIPVAIGSTSMGEPDIPLYPLLAPLFRRMEAARKLGVIHLYTPNSYFPWDFNDADIEYLARRHEEQMLKVCAAEGIEPPPMMHGEYNTVKSKAEALTGPKAMRLPVATWVAGIKKAAVKYATNIFVYGPGLYDQLWAGFDISGDDDWSKSYRDAMVYDLPRSSMTFLEEWEASVASVDQLIDMAAHMTPGTNRVYGLGGVQGSSGWEDVMCFRLPTGYCITQKNGEYEELWYDDTYIYRGADTSRAPEGDIYSHFSGDRYGAPWAPRWWKKGDVFKRTPDVRVFRLSDGTVLQYDRHVISYLKFVEYHKRYTFSSGITVENVAEVLWLAADMKTQIERYFYARDIGPVGFYYLPGGGYNSEIALYPSSKPMPARRDIPWFARYRPALPPLAAAPTPPSPTPALPKAPEEYGPLVDVVVTKTAAETANVRDLPSAASQAAVVATVRKGDILKARIAKPHIDPLYQWVVVESINGVQVKKNGQAITGYLSNVALLTPIINEVMLVDLKAPYVSQLDANAAKYKDDCGNAAMLSEYRRWVVSKGGVTPTIPTVDDVVAKTALPGKPKGFGLNVTDMLNFGRALGLEFEYIQPMNLAAIKRYLDDGRCPICVVGYDDFNPNDPFDGSHWVTVDGYGATSIKAQDSYTGGPNVILPNEQFDKALRNTGNELDYIGIVLKKR